jgi:hypothetical protein
MSIELVFAMGAAVVTLPTGGTVQVAKGSHWPATDPVVRHRPDLFTTDPRYGLFYTVPPPGYDASLEPVDEHEVETATSNPGEKRSVRRARND